MVSYFDGQISDILPENIAKKTRSPGVKLCTPAGLPPAV